jgi:hypothetical protein
MRFAKGFGICLASLLFSYGLQAQPADTADRTGDDAPPNTTLAEPVKYVPMTQKERLDYFKQHLFSAESVVRSAAGSAINQLDDTPHEWRQGAAGYGRRFASSYGEHIIQSTTMYGISAALHEDNRYYRSGLNGFGPRLKYAIKSSFMARHDNGTQHFSFSRILSYGAAATISREWQPPSTNGWENGVDNFAVSIGVETGFNVAREFLPSIFHARPPVAH